MTVETTLAREQYATNGTTGPWSVRFYFLEDDHLQVIYTDEDGAEATLTLNAGYTVTGAGDEAGGTVTTTTAYASGGYITILRNVEPLQEVDLIDGDSLPAETLETAFDKLTMLAQQALEVTDRALVFAPSDTSGSTLPAAAARASKLLGFDSDGVLSLSAPTSGSAADLALDLASSANAAEGAGMIGYDPDLAYAAGTVGAKLLDQISVFDYMTTAQIADVRARTAALDVTAAVQAAINAIDTATVGSWELLLPDGTYLISGSGARILEVQAGLKIRGQSLEGTRLKVATGSTSTTVMEDDGSAAKIELSNFTIDVNSNASVTYGLRLGKRTTQFGTYGTVDNLMVRGSSHASFKAYDFDVNIVSAGKLYTLFASGDGLLSDDGGSGLHVQAFTPLDWTGIGISMATGDAVDYAEFEAPASDDAIAAKFSRGGTISAWVLSIQSGRTMKTPFLVDDTYVDDFYLGPGKIIRSGTLNSSNTARWGNLASPALASTCTAGGANYLEDSGQAWGVDQWRGGMVHITGGTGSGQANPIISNTRRRLVTPTWTTPPDATSTYKLDYFVKKSGGGGYAFSESGTAYWPAYYNVSVTNEMRAQKLVAGLHAHGGPAPTIASAGTIAPTTPVAFVSGTTTISTITAPSPISGTGGTIKLIPTGLWSTNTAGNIALATTAVVSRVLELTYDAITGKWYPSYT